jgi:hypothetical protein
MATAGDVCTTLMNEDGTCQLVDNVLTCVPTSTTGSGGAGGSGSGGATTTSGNGGSSTSSGGDSEDEGGCSVAALGHAGGGEPAWLLFALAGLGLAWRKRGA